MKLFEKKEEDDSGVDLRCFIDDYHEWLNLEFVEALEKRAEAMILEARIEEMERAYAWSREAYPKAGVLHAMFENRLKQLKGEG